MNELTPEAVLAWISRLSCAERCRLVASAAANRIAELEHQEATARPAEALEQLAPNGAPHA